MFRNIKRQIGPKEPPKKYIRVNGLMKLNPQYKKWKQTQTGQPATTIPNSKKALPIVSDMADYELLNQGESRASKVIPLAESTQATMEMMQDPDISVEAGMSPDTMMAELGRILNKYEVPIGLMNKLMMLTEYDSLEFIIDDSGSMNNQSDTKNPLTNTWNTRWEEAWQRLKEMMEVLAYVPFHQIGIEFLNRRDRIQLQRNGRDPRSFLGDAYGQIDGAFSRQLPSGTTPALEKLQESLIRGAGGEARIARYFFGDGVPNGGLFAQREIINILKNRQDPAGNPVTFISCTNEDDQVEWMKEAEEIIPYCAELDDFQDESDEVLRDQGEALPFSRGFHLVCQLVSAMNPEDLDAMDESVPFTKETLDNLMGVVLNEQSYRHYFDCFLQAQRRRTVASASDRLKKNVNWKASYQQFVRASVASQIPAVQQFKSQLQQTMIAH